MLPSQFHASVILGGLDSDNREFGPVVEVLVRDGRQAGAKFIAEDAFEEPRMDFPRWWIVNLLPSYPQRLGEGLRVHFLGCTPLLLGRALCLVGGCGFGWGGGGTFCDPLDRGGLARNVRRTSAIPGRRQWGKPWATAAWEQRLVPGGQRSPYDRGSGPG